MKSRTILIRADADAEIGWGHAMRMYALAEAWTGLGGEVVWVTQGLPQQLLDSNSEIRVRWRRLQDCPRGSQDDAEQTGHWAFVERAAWLILDDYSFDDRYEALLASTQIPLVALDDAHHARHEQAAMIICPARDRAQELSPFAPQSELMMGTRFALLRRAVTNQKAWRSPPLPSPHSRPRVAVTCGGSDPSNATSFVLHALESISPEARPAVEVIVGGASKHRLDIARRLSSWESPWTLHVDVPSIAAVLTGAALVVTAGGTTMLESLALACPTVALATAENQVAGCEELAQRGCLVYLGRMKELCPLRTGDQLQALLGDATQQQLLSQLGQRAVDGRGAERIARRLAWGRVTLRAAHEHDCRPLFDLRNDQEVVAASLNPRPVTWEEHCTWFAQILNRSIGRLWIASGAEGQFLGQVRIDVRSPGEAELSISLVPAARGLGLGSVLIRQALNQWIPVAGAMRLIARVRAANQASRRSFERAGFRACPSVDADVLTFAWHPTGRHAERHPRAAAHSTAGRWRPSAGVDFVRHD